MTYCTNCGTPRDSGNRFCTGCGAQVSAASSTRPHSRGRFVIALTALVLLLGGGGVAAWATLTHGTSPPAPPRPATPPDQSQAATAPFDQSDPSRTASALLGTASASTSCAPSLAGHDANGKVFTYEPEKAIDNLRDTAWRCDGDGVGKWLEISFQSKVTLTSIGIVPGYAKTDPQDGADRYAQNRRISAVTYTFDDGSTIPQSFDTGAHYRSTQTISLPNVSTSHVRITILSSVGGEATGGQQSFEKVAISDIIVSVR